VDSGLVRTWSEETKPLTFSSATAWPVQKRGRFHSRAPPNTQRTLSKTLMWVGGCDGFGRDEDANVRQVGLWLPPKASQSGEARPAPSFELRMDHPHEQLAFEGSQPYESLLARYERRSVFRRANILWSFCVSSR